MVNLMWKMSVTNRLRYYAKFYLYNAYIETWRLSTDSIA